MKEILKRPRYIPTPPAEFGGPWAVRVATLEPGTRATIFPATRGAVPFYALIVEKRQAKKQPNNPNVIVERVRATHWDSVSREWRISFRKISIGGGTTAVG